MAMLKLYGPDNVATERVQRRYRQWSGSIESGSRRPGLKAFKEQRRTRYLELSEVGTLISAMRFRVMTERATLLHSGT